jgi:hypothetical protein
MQITEQEHRLLYQNYCMMNGLKMSSAHALKQFCEFSKKHYIVRG